MCHLKIRRMRVLLVHMPILHGLAVGRSMAPFFSLEKQQKCHNCRIAWIQIDVQIWKRLYLSLVGRNLTVGKPTEG